jgi:hypothetical protein
MLKPNLVYLQPQDGQYFVRKQIKSLNFLSKFYINVIQKLIIQG